jgi:hypothetical protein
MAEPTDDITLRQAGQIAEHLMPRFELALQQKLEPLEARIAAIEGVWKTAGWAWHAVTAAVTFILTVFGGSAFKDRN